MLQSHGPVEACHYGRTKLAVSGAHVQVDWGGFTELTPDRHQRSVWTLVLVRCGARARSLTFVAQADLATCGHCQLHAFHRSAACPATADPTTPP